MKDFLTNSVFFGAVISLVAYEIGTLLKKKFKLAIFNPLLIAVICVMAVLFCFILIMIPITKVASISVIC